MQLSLVIPVMNEEDNIKPLFESIKKALKDIDYEIIIVDDGSSDNTLENLKKYKYEKVKIIVLNRNYGQTTAISAGIKESRGDIIALMDGDLQNDPRDIPLMIEKLKEGNWDVVAGIRENRKDNFLRKFPSKIANWIIRKTTRVNIKDYGCTLKVFKKEVAKNLDLYGELHRFIPVLAKIYGAKITQMRVRHHPRVHGSSKYGIGRTFKVISDLLFMIFMLKYRQKPMHLFGTIGIPIFLAGLFINIYMAVLKLLGYSIGGRPLLLLGVLLLLVGIQLITSGFLAELIMRTYFESQNKKPYSIKEIIE